MKRIVLFQFSESGWRIAAAELELLEKHLLVGDSVIAVTCKGCRFGCDLNLTRQKLLCFNCRNQTRRGFKAMSQPIERRDYTEYLKPEDDAIIFDIGRKCSQPQQELRKARLDNFDIGEAVVSILISRHRNTDIEPHATPEIARNLLEAGVAAYLAAIRVIEEHKPDLVYLFNGRGSQQRAILRACEKLNIDFDVIEEGCDLAHYALFRNSTPHDIRFRTSKIQMSWAQGDQAALTALAESFFNKRVAGFNGYGIMRSHTHSQEKGRFPLNWDPNSHNVVIYCSSEDEFAAIGDQWKNQLYGSQLNGLRQISQSIRTSKCSVSIYLRMHPNLSNLHNSFRRECESLAHDRFVVIPPESPISSYDLMFAANTVVTFASTIGIEAVYWGKPCILVGSCFYQDLDVAYKPESHEEAMRMIEMDLAPKERKGALMYASYLMSFGEPYIMSEVGAYPMDFKFRGVHLRGGVIMRTLLSIRERFTGPTIERLTGSQDDTPHSVVIKN